MPRDDLIQYRRGTHAQWETANPVLAEGEVGYTTDAPHTLKIGDGWATWTALPVYLSNESTGGGTGPVGPIDTDDILYHAEGSDFDFRIKAGGAVGTPFIQGRYRQGDNTEWIDIGPLTGLLDYTGLQAALAAQWDVEGIRWQFVPDGGNGAALYLQQNNIPGGTGGEFKTVFGFHNDGKITGPDGNPIGGGGAPSHEFTGKTYDGASGVVFKDGSKPTSEVNLINDGGYLTVLNSAVDAATGTPVDGWSEGNPWVDHIYFRPVTRRSNGDGTYGDLEGGGVDFYTYGADTDYGRSYIRINNRDILTEGVYKLDAEDANSATYARQGTYRMSQTCANLPDFTGAPNPSGNARTYEIYLTVLPMDTQRGSLMTQYATSDISPEIFTRSRYDHVTDPVPQGGERETIWSPWVKINETPENAPGLLARTLDADNGEPIGGLQINNPNDPKSLGWKISVDNDNHLQFYYWISTATGDEPATEDNGYWSYAVSMSAPFNEQFNYAQPTFWEPPMGFVNDVNFVKTPTIDGPNNDKIPLATQKYVDDAIAAALANRPA